MKEKQPIKIIIADDDHFARKGLESVLLNMGGINKIAHAENGKEVVALLEKEFFHIVFMDLKMPEMDGFDTTSHIHEHFRKVNVIAFTIHGTDEMLFEMYDRGAMGYILKTDDETQVRTAVDAVMSGNYFYADGGKRIFDHIKDEELRKLHGLTNDKLSRPETEMLIHICEEMSLKEITEVMHISEWKTQYHHKRLLFKTGAKNLAGLVKYAIRNKIYIDNSFFGLGRLFKRS